MTDHELGYLHTWQEISVFFPSFDLPFLSLSRPLDLSLGSCASGWFSPGLVTGMITVHAFSGVKLDGK